MKKFFILLAVLSVLSTVAYAFYDVTQSHRFYKSVDFIEEKGIVDGYVDGSFKPENNINRAELLKIIVESKFDVSASFAGENCFSDVPANEWFTKYVCFAKSSGIVQGYSDGTFKPANFINFVEALKITLKAYNIDFDKTNIWYEGMVNAAANRNLIPLTIHRFDQQITRGEMADMIARFYNEERGDLDEYLGDEGAFQVDYSSIEAGEYKEFYYQEFLDELNSAGGNNNTPVTYVDENDYCNHETCDDDEICMNGECTEAPLTLVFINGGFEDDEFNDAVNRAVAAFAQASPLKTCSGEIRVHRLEECCTDSEYIEDCAKKSVDKFDQAILLHPYQVFTEGCGATSSKDHPAITVIDCEHTFVHEMGHALGDFEDQYCYQDPPAEINPVTDDNECGYSEDKREFNCPAPGVCWNRETHEDKRLIGGVCTSNEECEGEFGEDFECVSCYPVAEDTWEYEYCGVYNDPPIFCMGNLTSSGGRSVMGGGGGGPGDALGIIEFDENEYSVLEDILSCK